MTDVQSPVGAGVSFKKNDKNLVRDIRNLAETGSVVDSITDEQRILDRVEKETGQRNASLVELL